MPTFVTCLYDLTKRGHAQHRTVDWLFAHSAYVMEMPYQLVVFCDPELADEVRKRRANRSTVVIEESFESMIPPCSFNHLSGELQQNASKQKVTRTYVDLMWAKYGMIDEVISRGCDTNALGWIDVAITHVATPAPYSVFEEVDYSDDRIRAHAMRLFDGRTVSHPDYWRNVQGHLSGGLVIGHPKAMRKLVNEFVRTIARAFDHGLCVLDEGLLSYIAGTKPTWFKLNYGDYVDILTNFGKIRGGDQHLRWMLAAGQADHQDTSELRERMEIH
jgi:hypothetical protein